MSKKTDSGAFGIEIDPVLERIALISDAENDNQLAAALGVPRQVLFGWRKRGTIPYEKLVEFAVRHSVLLDYLLWGKEVPIAPPSARKPKPITLNGFGTLLGLGFDKGGYANVLIGNPDVRRILQGLIAYEMRKEHRDHMTIEKIRDLIDHYSESYNNAGLEFLAEVVIAAHAVKLEPEWPEPTKQPNAEILEALAELSKNEHAKVTQHISGTDHQIAGGDMINEAPKKKRKK